MRKFFGNISYDLELLRFHGSLLGALIMLAGLVAFFVEPVPGYGEQTLFFIGLVVFMVCSIKKKNGTSNGSVGGLPPGR